MTTILVTGATGNVGHHLVRQLAGRDVTTRAFVRDPEAAAARLGDLGRSVELHVGDLDDPATIRAALRSVDRVVLAAADGPAKVAQEQRVIDLAAEAGVELVVKLSAMHADESSPLPAFAWHGTIERHLAASGLPAVVLQPAFFMANLLMVAPGIAATDTLFAPSGGAKVAMVDVRDVAAVAAAVLCDPTYAGHMMTVTGPEAITFDDVAVAIGAAVGRPIRSVDLTPEEARPRFEGAAVPPWLRQHLEGVFELIRNGEFARTSDTVRRVTGGPGTDIAAFARDHAAAFASAG
jgi:uncharacterized protein YbjT (DUF2867 family)